MIGNGKPRLERSATRDTDVRGIGAALRSLWQDCSPDEGEGDVARALTTNFVLVATQATEDAARLALARVFPRTPCRAFLVLIADAAAADTASSGAAASVRTEITAATRCNGNTRDIVLEEVVIRMPHSRLSRLPGIVRPLLVNDLPSHLYWRADWPTDGPLADALLDLCEHLIVDSSAPQRGPTLEQLQAWRLRGTHNTDLAWLRLRPWRRALAEAFERIPWQPGQPTRGTIRHHTAGAASVVLLARWLERRLGATIDLDESGSQDPDHLLLRTGEFEVCIELQQGQLAAYVSTPARCDLPFRLPASRGSEGDLLAAAVDVG